MQAPPPQIMNLMTKKHLLSQELIQKLKNPIRIMERKRSLGFRRNFTVAFLLLIAPAGGSSPAEHIF